MDAMVMRDERGRIPVTDSAVLAHQADGALLVVGLGKTTYDLVAKAQDALEKASGRLLGIVLNRAPVKGADAPPYYDYRKSYDASPSDAADGEPVVAAETVPTAEAKPEQAAPRARSGRGDATPTPATAEPTGDDATTSGPAAAHDFESFIAGIEGAVAEEPRRRAGRN